MRVLLDECLNWRLGRALPGHFCTSVPRMGWSGIKNGALLEKMKQERFDVFIKGDRNLPFQQHLPVPGRGGGDSPNGQHAAGRNSPAYA